MILRNIYELTSVILGCMAVYGFLIYISTRKIRGIRWITLAYLSGSVGIMLVGHRDVLPGFWSTSGNVLVMLGNVFVYWAFVALMELGKRRYLFLYVTVLPELFIILYFTYVHPMPGARAVGYNLCLATQFLPLGSLVLRNGTKESRLPRFVMAGLYYLWAVNDLLRAGRVDISGPTVLLKQTQPLEMVGPVLSILFTVMTGAGFIWLAMVYLNADLEMQSRRDPLTGLLNRLAFSEAAEREVLRARRRHSALCVVIFDLDTFKGINDTYGHQAGDAALRIAAECMQHNMRAVDVIGRFGGDEFVAILPDTDMGQGCAVSERLRALIAETGLSHSGEKIALSASFGVATLDDTDKTWEEALSRGDRMLYKAKREGRNRVECGLANQGY